MIDPTDFTIGVNGDIEASTLETQLGSNNVTIESVNGGSGTNGDIFVNDELSWNTHTLTLTADRFIEMNAPIAVTGGGGLALEFGQSGTVASMPLGDYLARAPVSLAAGTSFTTLYGTDGTLITYTIINDEAGLLAIDSDMAGAYVLGNDITVTTDPWAPLGNAAGDISTATSFAGILDGLGHEIDGLTRANTDNAAGVGLFGVICPCGVVINLGLTNVNLAGLEGVGALAGLNAGLVANVYSTGTVTGSDAAGVGLNVGTNDDPVGGIGGLVGYNSGAISSSYSAATVTATTGDQSSGEGFDGGIGGLAGSNDGVIDNSYATGSVSGIRDVGGLVGFSLGSINFSHSAGAVSGTTNVGGLLGALADFMGFDPPGLLDGTYWNTTSSGQVTSASSGFNASTGLDGTAFQQQSSFSDFDFTNTWVIYDGVTDPLLRGFLTPYFVVADDLSQTYDGTMASGFTATEVTSPRPGTITGTVSLSGAATTATDAGDYTITPSGLTLSAAGQMDQHGVIIEYVDGTLTIDPAALTVTASDQSKTYGDTLNLGTSAFTSSGLIGSETIGSVTLTSSGSHAGSTTSGANSYTDDIVPRAATGGTFNASNYAITYAAGDLTIDPRALTLTLGLTTKTYGESVAPAEAVSTAFSAEGLAPGDAIDSVSLESENGLLQSITADARFYPNEINIVGINGDIDEENYTLSFVPGHLSIDPATVLITASDQTKNYGETLDLGVSTSNFSATGLKNGDAIESVLLANRNGYATSATQGAGLYENEIVINGFTESGSDFRRANYNFTYEDGDLTIDPRALTITAEDQFKVYGDVLDLGTSAFSSNGLVNGESIGAVTLTSVNGYAASTTEFRGTYEDEITASTATGGTFDPNNYAITYESGDLYIDPRRIVITASDQRKTYGSAMELDLSAFTVTGLVNDDMIDGVFLATTNGYETSTGQGVGVYEFEIQPQGVSGSGPNFSLTNYATALISGDFIIDPAPLTIVVEDQTKAFDGEPLDVTTLDFSINGLVAGDSQDVIGGNLILGGTALTATEPGTYPLELSGLTADNYVIVYELGDLTISQAVENAVATIQEQSLSPNVYPPVSSFHVPVVSVNVFREKKTAPFSSNKNSASPDSRVPSNYRTPPNPEYTEDGNSWTNFLSQLNKELEVFNIGAEENDQLKEDEKTEFQIQPFKRNLWDFPRDEIVSAQGGHEEFYSSNGHYTLVTAGGIKYQSKNAGRFLNDLMKISDAGDAVTQMNISGHGASERTKGANVITLTGGYLTSARDAIMLKTAEQSTDITALLAETLSPTASINLWGCNTARGNLNLAQDFSNMLPERTVQGFIFYAFAEQGRDGLSDPIGFRKTYRNGEPYRADKAEEKEPSLRKNKPSGVSRVIQVGSLF